MVGGLELDAGGLGQGRLLVWKLRVGLMVVIMCLLSLLSYSSVHLSIHLYPCTLMTHLSHKRPTTSSHLLHNASSASCSATYRQHREHFACLGGRMLAVTFAPAISNSCL
jgi:hypothetical protein